MLAEIEESVIGLVAVSGFFATVMTVVFITNVCHTVRKIRIARTNSDLVINLANRGFSPDEIKGIVIASSGNSSFEITNPGELGKPPRHVNVPPQKPIAQQQHV